MKAWKRKQKEGEEILIVGFSFSLRKGMIRFGIEKGLGRMIALQLQTTLSSDAACVENPTPIIPPFLTTPLNKQRQPAFL